MKEGQPWSFSTEKRLMAVMWLEDDDGKRTWVRERYMHGSA